MPQTGCQIEQRRLEEAHSLLRLLALLAPMAVELLSLREQARLEPELLSLREQARLEPEVLAATVLPADLLQVVADLSERSPQRMTLHEFWRAVAQQGGYLGRKRDGPPGWKSLWQGWLYIQTLLRGFRLASGSHPT